MSGCQNSIEQAKLFNDATNLSGVVLTKIDGTGKGGVVFAISHELSIPIAYITFGEGLSDIDAFDSKRYVDGLLDISV